MKKTITIHGYPCSFGFETNAVLPKFEYGCPTRTELVQSAMRKQNINSPYHHYDDYIVEIVQCLGNGDELWRLGS